ncbi:MAG: PEPxxWA-CTERM sorting domain-containing protein [Pseudomonadota bacterium]
MTQHKILRKHGLSLLTIAGLSCASALPAQIAQVDYTSLTGTEFISFSDVVGGPPPGTNYDGILVVDGVAFGEHFAGQTVTPSGNFDVLSGTPMPGLTLMAGAAGQNLTFFQAPPGPVLSGNGPAGFPVSDAIGEGAVSLLFSSDQAEFGFRLAGGHSGTATIGFFRVDGTLIQSIALNNLPLTAAFGFLRDGGVADVRGISIWNEDLTGIGLAGLRHNVVSAIAPVPEPSTWATMLAGFGMIGFALRRRRRQSQAPAQFA